MNVMNENWIDAELESLSLDSKIIELVKEFEQKTYDYETMTELDVAYGVLSGYIECCNAMNIINDDSTNALNNINLTLYKAAQKRISARRYFYREQDGLKALQALLNRNLNESGSGAETVKRFLLGLYNGVAYPFCLTDLRNLDSENFDNVLAVLNMNARSSPRREIHNYFVNGNELWDFMKKKVAVNRKG